jgi:major vault protein
MKSENDHESQDGTLRKAGEMYVIINPHFYLCDVNETIVKVNTPIILSSLKAIKLSASINLKDVYGKTRKAGDIWLISRELAAWHTLNLHEELV